MTKTFSIRHFCRRGASVVGAVGTWLLPVAAWAQDFKPLRDDIPSQKFLGVNVVQDLSGQIVNSVLGVVGAVAMFMIMYGGFQVIMGGKTSEDRINSGKKTILWAAIGLVAVFAAYAIVNTLLERLTGAAGVVPEAPQ